MEESRKGFGVFGALASRLVRPDGRLRRGARRGGPSDMEQEADQYQSDQEEGIEQQGWYHDDVSFHGGERRLFYRIHLLSNYPLVTGTGPLIERFP
jgi:hypothetical protein